MRFASRLAGFTAVMSALAVALSFLAVPFVAGSRIHFFQVTIMLAGVMGGPLSGVITGTIGGAYMAMLRSDPTIVIGNALLGLFTGLFVRGMRPALAGIAAWALIQAPWVYVTGTYIFNVPGFAMQLILVLLAIEDVICSIAVDVLESHFHLREMVFPKSASA
jgi:uncharacterized membrane protein